MTWKAKLYWHILLFASRRLFPVVSVYAPYGRYVRAVILAQNEYWFNMVKVANVTDEVNHELG